MRQALRIIGCKDFEVIDCTFAGVSTGMVIEGSAGVLVKDNTLIDVATPIVVRKTREFVASGNSWINSGNVSDRGRQGQSRRVDQRQRLTPIARAVNEFFTGGCR